MLMAEFGKELTPSDVIGLVSWLEDICAKLQSEPVETADSASLSSLQSGESLIEARVSGDRRKSSTSSPPYYGGYGYSRRKKNQNSRKQATVIRPEIKYPKRGESAMLRGHALQRRLPGPTGLELEFARRALVQTYCWDDRTCIGPWHHRWGTGFFVDIGDKQENEPPRYIVTSSLNCGFPDQTVFVRQNKRWASARVIAKDHNLCVMLLEINHPMRFSSWSHTSSPFPLAYPVHADRADHADDEAAVIGYHHCFTEHHLPIQAVLPACLRAASVGKYLILEFTKRWRGSPIVTRNGVIGVAIGWDHHTRKMSILSLPNLRVFLETAIASISPDIESTEDFAPESVQTSS